MSSPAAVTVMGAKRAPGCGPRATAQPSPAEQQSRLLHYAGLKFMDTVFASAMNYRKC